MSRARNDFTENNSAELDRAWKKLKLLNHKIRLERYNRSKEQKEYTTEKDTLQKEIEKLKQKIETLEKNKNASDLKKEDMPKLPFVPLAPLDPPAPNVSSGVSEEKDKIDVAKPASTAHSRLSLWYWMGYDKPKESVANQETQSVQAKVDAPQAETSQPDSTPKLR